MKELAQISVAVYLVIILFSFAWAAWKAPAVRLTQWQMRKGALYGVAGCIAEAVTLYAAGTWS